MNSICIKNSHSYSRIVSHLNSYLTSDNSESMGLLLCSFICVLFHTVDGSPLNYSMDRFPKGSGIQKKGKQSLAL